MEHTSTHTPQPSRQSFKKERSSRLRPVQILLIVVAVLLILWLLFFRGTKDSAKYEVSNQKATASFELDVDYLKNCKDQKDCDPNKPNFSSIKLFVFDKNGTQVRVVRADKDGKFTASLPEGNYILLTAKTFEDKDTLPQQAVELKKGKLLKLKVNYGTELTQPKEY